MRRDWLEDESNAERWMVSYADFITLLFAFFVVMYAISSVNDEKYRVLSNTLAEAFAVEAASLEPIQVGEPAMLASPHVVDLPNSSAFADQTPGDTTMVTQNTELETALGAFAEDGGFSLRSDNDWIELDLDADVLFASGQAQLSDAAKVLLDQTADEIARTNNPITIEGYTDNVVGNSQLYPSNWELSAARASAVARHFVERGIRANRISAVGYGENHPVATNATPSGRAQNRRVVVVLARDIQTARNRNTSSAVAVIQGREEPTLDNVGTHPDTGRGFAVQCRATQLTLSDLLFVKELATGDKCSRLKHGRSICITLAGRTGWNSWLRVVAHTDRKATAPDS